MTVRLYRVTTLVGDIPAFLCRAHARGAGRAVRDLDQPCDRCDTTRPFVPTPTSPTSRLLPPVTTTARPRPQLKLKAK